MFKKRIIRSSMTITLIITMLVCMIPSGLNWSYAADEPFTRTATEYGIKNELVSAAKVKLNSNTSVIDIINNLGVMLLKDGDRYYLVGRGGEVIKSWQTEETGNAPGIEICYYPDVWSEGISLSRGERAYPYNLVQVKDPDTGKYDIYNADTGEYHSCQADSLSSFSYDEGAFLTATYGDKVALISPTGRRTYDKTLFEEIEFVTLYNDVLYFKAKGESGKYVIISSDGQYEISNEYLDITPFEVDNSLNEYEAHALDAYVTGEIDSYTSQMINISTGEILADGMEFKSLGYAGDRVFYGVNTSSDSIIMTDHFWYDAAEKMGFSECRIYSGASAGGNIFAMFNNRDKNGNGTDYTDIIFDRYGDEIITGEDIVFLTKNYYVAYSQESGNVLKSIKSRDVVRTDLGIPTNGFESVGNFVLFMNKRVEGEDPEYFWFNTDTGEVVVDGIKTRDYCFTCEQKGSGYITLQDTETDLCGIIDTAAGTFSGFVYDYDFMYHAFEGQFKARGVHKEDGSGMILTTFTNEDDETDLRVYDKDFNELVRFNDAEIISVDSNKNYTISVNDGDDQKKNYIIRSDGTVSGAFYLHYKTSLRDHHRTIRDNKSELLGLSASDGSVILPAEYQYVGRELNGIIQVSDDSEFLDYWERLYSCGFVDYYGDWLIHEYYYTQGDDQPPGRNLVMRGSGNAYYFYDLNDYVDGLYSDDDTIYYNHKPVKEITEDDLYGDQYQYLNNKFYAKVAQRLWGDMNLIYGERSAWDNRFAVFVNNMKEGGVESFINAIICDLSGEYYKQTELEEQIAMGYLQSITEDQSIATDLIKGFNKEIKLEKRVYEIVESGFKNAAEKKELAKLMAGNILPGTYGFT